ncbi:CoA-disulfide reductase [Phocicoccus pinnipedialis]|uniref:Coenzyme A disulfide reductase n=1 Tax=Phocicoccus pinnipedialis TaxID=110845 RepID=A0A6V7R7H8_9BACL|nr:CoA-disulfide reductase [Jeotgalicoccus pinnipedialis]MBP1938904.1 CoA-disulfide reductase [Jeotgalicoccus pinnipedialis]CAD2073256.1 Coenzyme A disulfide reductase [Jeotgalicoccus pinnipedialis]
MKVIVVGGVAGGMTTASQLRRIDHDAEIHVFEKGPHISFANCGLPYYISREVEKRTMLVERTPEDMEKRGIHAHVAHEVLDVNTKNKTISVKALETGEIKNIRYNKLVLSPGGRSVMLNALKNVPQSFVLQQLHQLDSIEDYIETHNVNEVVVVGTGFIGIEVTENFVRRGFKVTVIQHNNDIYSPIEPDMKEFMYDTLKEQGVDLKLNSEILEVDGNKATLNTGEILNAPLIIVAVGIKPNTTFLEDTDIKLEKGYIPVNEFGQTNIKDVYAVGDAILTHYTHVPEKPVNVALAWPAHRLAFVIANHISGNTEFKHDGFLSTSILEFFGHTIAQVGLSRKDLDKDTKYIDHIQANIAGYMKNPEKIHARLYYDDDGKILRGVFVGKEGVDKRLNVLATFMRTDGNIKNLINIEVGYAPPFGTPKDLLNMIGYKAIEKLKES